MPCSFTKHCRLNYIYQITVDTANIIDNLHNPRNATPDPTKLIERKEKGSKCYWVKKQIETFHLHPLKYNVLDTDRSSATDMYSSCQDKIFMIMFTVKLFPNLQS